MGVRIQLPLPSRPLPRRLTLLRSALVERECENQAAWAETQRDALALHQRGWMRDPVVIELAVKIHERARKQRELARQAAGRYDGPDAA